MAIGSLIVNLFFISFLVGKRYYYAHSAVQEASIGRSWGDVWNDDRKDVFESLSISNKDIVFVGNSLTEGFPLTEMFAGRPVKNRGIGWNESRHVVGRIAGIAQFAPRKIFIEMGINDFIAHTSPDTVFNNFKETVRIIRNISPSTVIYIQSVTPNGRGYYNNQPSIVVLNSLLKGYCDQENIRFVDLYSLFYKNGGLDSACTYDGIHFNGKGYAIWKSAIDSLVN